MYILLDSFSDTSLPLQNTFSEIGTECTYLVLNDDRFLPIGFISMFEFIIDSISTLPDNFQDVLLPCVNIPQFYSITADTNLYGYILHLGQRKGKIWFRRDCQKICADRVERIDENDNIVRLDHYDRYGFIAFSDFYNDEQKIVSRSYYSADNKPVLNYSYSNDTYSLLDDSHVFMTFNGKKALISYCMSLLISKNERIVPTSFAQITQLKQLGLLDKQHGVFLFQSAEDYQKYLEDLNVSRESRSVVIMNNASTIRLNSPAISGPGHMIRYICKNTDIHTLKLNTLTLTRSDQIESLAELAMNNPHITFHVAAYTMVSPTLLAYEKYNNIKIHPSISPQKLQELLSICGFYLDINHYYEAPEAIVSAAVTPLLIMGFKDTLHNPDYVLPEYVFPTGDHLSFAKALNQLSSDQSLYNEHLNRQIEENRKTNGILKTLLTEGETLT